MAEGHAVHGIAQRLRQFLGQPVRSSSPNDRFEATVFDGRVIADARAVGKHPLVTAHDVELTAHLHLARLDPFTPGREIDDDTFGALWQDTVDLMTLGLGAGWIVTDEAQMAAAREALVRGERVPRWPKRYAVDGRAGKPCPVCGTTVGAQQVGLQRLFWCPGCQPAGPASAGPTAIGEN